MKKKLRNFYSVDTDKDDFFGITELGNSICNKSATEPNSQDVRNIEDKHTPFRELQNLHWKNPEKVIAGQRNI